MIIATGAKWRELGIPGEKEHIGLGVAFCAHCDGPFYKDRRVAVVGGGCSGLSYKLDFDNEVKKALQWLSANAADVRNNTRNFVENCYTWKANVPVERKMFEAALRKSDNKK